MIFGDPSAGRGELWARLRLTLLPLIVALVVIGVQVVRKPTQMPDHDEFYYMTIARDLSLHRTFTDGTFRWGPFENRPGPKHFGDESPEWSKPGRFFAPAYPLIVYALSTLDTQLRTAIFCHVSHGHLPSQASCPVTFRSLVTTNVVLWALGIAAIFAAARHATGSEAIGWAAFALALSTGDAPLYARTYLSENIAIPAFLVFILFAVRALAYGKVRDYAFAGALLGIAALARPSYVYLLYVLLATLLLSAVLGKRRTGLPRGTHALAFVGASALVLAPWLIRNVVQFGDPALSRGYAEVILTQRVSYNRMSIGEWLVALIYWLPDFGDNVAAALFPKPLYARLDFDNPQGFYLEGAEGAFRAAILREADNETHVFDLLIKKYLLGDLPWHTLVSVPLTIRGLGVGQYLSVASALLLWPATRYFVRNGRLHLFLAMLLPPLFMVVLHGLVSVNIARYNLPLLCVYATIIAVVVVPLLEDAVSRSGRRDGGAA